MERFLTKITLKGISKVTEYVAKKNCKRSVFISAWTA